MDENQYKERVERLNEVNEVISKLDPAIRADAFTLLRPYVTGRAPDDGADDETDDTTNGSAGGARDGTAGRTRQSGDGTDEDRLVEEFESDKEFENALLALAILYARHGRASFSMGAIRAIAKEFDLAIPERVDVTLRGMKRNDAKLLRKQANGDYKVTPGGETWLKSTYGVAKGRQPVGDE